MKKFWKVLAYIANFLGYVGIIVWMVESYFFTTPDPHIDRLGIMSLILLVTWHLEKEDE